MTTIDLFVLTTISYFPLFTIMLALGTTIIFLNDYFSKIPSQVLSEEEGKGID